MRLDRFVLSLSAVTFTAIGLAFLVAPVALAALVDVRLPTDRAVVELTTLYGGLEIGIGAALFVCSRRDAWVAPGLVVSAAALGAAALVRAAQIVRLEAYDGTLLALLLAEAVGAAASAWALRRAR